MNYLDKYCIERNKVDKLEARSRMIELACETLIEYHEHMLDDVEDGTHADAIGSIKIILSKLGDVE